MTQKGPRLIQILPDEISIDDSIQIASRNDFGYNLTVPQINVSNEKSDPKILLLPYSAAEDIAVWAFFQKRIPPLAILLGRIKAEDAFHKFQEKLSPELIPRTDEYLCASSVNNWYRDPRRTQTTLPILRICQPRDIFSDHERSQRNIYSTGFSDY